MSSMVFTHLFRVSLASGIFYSNQRFHMEVPTITIISTMDTLAEVVDVSPHGFYHIKTSVLIFDLVV
jgi:hypothetical protein